MAYELVTVERSDDFATVSLNHPAKRNALSLAMMHDLIDGLHEASAANVRGIVLAANGPVFSAGHDFADMAGQNLAFLRQLLATCTELMTLVQEVPQPVVAKVHALATAAGCQLVASCDLAIAADTAQFALPGGKGGLFCTTLVAVARNVGRKRALELAMTGDPIDARDGRRLGTPQRSRPARRSGCRRHRPPAAGHRGSASSKAIGKAAFYAQVDLDQPKAYAYTTR